MNLYYMRHLMRYEGYTSVERTDDILDKISRYGIKSISALEKEFLDAHKAGSQEELHSKLAKSEGENTYEDDNGHFKFEFDSSEDYGDEIHYIGTLYTPELSPGSGKKIEGRLTGRIIVSDNGATALEFYSESKDPQTLENYDVFEFCEGLEYELDSFIDYVVIELYKKD